jgi:hypothetical protein
MEAADLCDGGLRAGTPPRGGNGSFAYLLICWRTGGRFRALLGPALLIVRGCGPGIEAVLVEFGGRRRGP